MTTEVTLEDAAARIEELEGAVARIASTERRLEETRKAVRDVQNVLGLIDQNKAAKKLHEVKERLGALSRRLEVEILKDTVLSEVTRIYPEIWVQLIRALDNDDEWWRTGEALTIKQWRDRVTQ